MAYTWGIHRASCLQDMVVRARINIHCCEASPTWEGDPPNVVITAAPEYGEGFYWMQAVGAWDIEQYRESNPDQEPLWFLRARDELRSGVPSAFTIREY